MISIATGVNHSKTGCTRVAQYITYSLAEVQTAEQRRGRAEFWAEGRVGNGNRLGLPNEPGRVPLSALGRKIASLEPWPTKDAGLRIVQPARL